MRRRVMQRSAVRRPLLLALLATSACTEARTPPPERSAQAGAGTVRATAARVEEAPWPSFELLEGRFDHSAVAIGQGSALVCGGWRRPVPIQPIETCELLSLERAETAPPLGAPRQGMTMTLLGGPPEWSVLLVGGGVGVNLDADELVGDKSDWSRQRADKQKRRHHTLSLLDDGTALMVGGDDGLALVPAVAVRSPSGAWEFDGEQARSRHSTVVVPPKGEDGAQATETVVAIGGFDAAGDGLDSVGRYSVANRRWRAGAPMQEPRGGHTGTLLDDGTVLVVGGTGFRGTDPSKPPMPISTALRYDVAGDVWWCATPGRGDCGTTGVPVIARSDHRAERLGRYVVVVGGVTVTPESRPALVPEVQVYDPVSDSWANLKPLGIPRKSFALTKVSEDTLLVSGGTDDKVDLTSVEVIRPIALGARCAAGEECVSGHCVDRLCCESACDGPCRTCGVTPGLCTAVDGKPPVDGSDACNGFLCAEGRCSELCRADTDCMATHHCDAGVCALRRGLGAACDRDRVCAESSFCTDGVCCDGPCEGQCEACSSRGVCEARRGPPIAPRPGCDVQGDPECLATCDGVERGRCVYPDRTKACGARGCADGVETHRGACDQHGRCEQDRFECGAFACGERACLSECTRTEDCAPGHYCARGVCTPECSDNTDCGPGEVCQDRRCWVPRCTQDRRAELALDGTERDCGRFTCDPQSGTCATRCTSNWNCARAHYCASDGACRELPVFTEELGGCSASPAEAPGSRWAVLLSAVLVGVWRRRRVLGVDGVEPRRRV